ncbi:MAG: bifunctional folylpolyglutamate synthase/dihydrofolate synthase [Actinobacteria bacterium]|nr:bifunctional folylpolyglutamate synthase/dihydrofolate synthase [Actinomycetota bacterium]
MVPDLDRIRSLADLMGDPQGTYPSIHITGTNGKTSVSRMVTALLGALGIQTGTFTSPHLQSVRERIRVAGRPISEEGFARAYEDVARVAELVDERSDERVTYFEMLTAMAYWWFADHPVEVGVFEVGMGGLWDATNLVRGEVAVLTRVDVDHPELGDTPAEVAREKVGIIKPGATVVTVEQTTDVERILSERVSEQGATVFRVGAGADVEVTDRRLAVGGQQLTFRTPTRTYENVFLPVHGTYQADNAAVALAALHAFLGGLQEVDDEVIREGFGAVEVPGRLEVANRDPTVILDGAHNPAGARRTAADLEETFAFRDVILVIACLDDKDVEGIVSAFRDVASHVIVTQAPSRRAASLDRMASVAEGVWEGTSVIVERARDVDEAIAKATGVVGETDGVLVTGSLYTVGAARDRYVPSDGPG